MPCKPMMFSRSSPCDSLCQRGFQVFSPAIGATVPHLFRVHLFLALPRVDLFFHRSQKGELKFCPRSDKQAQPEFPLKQWTRESPSSSPPDPMESWDNLRTHRALTYPATTYGHGSSCPSNYTQASPATGSSCTSTSAGAAPRYTSDANEGSPHPEPWW